MTILLPALPAPMESHRKFQGLSRELDPRLFLLVGQAPCPQPALWQVVEDLWPQPFPGWSLLTHAHLALPLVPGQKPALPLDHSGTWWRGELESRCFEESGPGGLRVFSRCCVDVAVAAPTTCLQPLVAQWPVSQEKTPQRACSVTHASPTTRDEEHSSCSAFER